MNEGLVGRNRPLDLLHLLLELLKLCGVAFQVLEVTFNLLHQVRVVDDREFGIRRRKRSEGQAGGEEHRS